MAKNINRRAVRSVKGESVDFSQLQVVAGSATQDIGSRQAAADKTDAKKKVAAYTITPPRKDDPAAPDIMKRIKAEKKSIRSTRKTETTAEVEAAPVEETETAQESE